MTDKFEEKILELNSIEERMKSTPVYNIDRKYMNKFKSERVKRKYEQKKNLKFKKVLDTVKTNLELIKIDSKKLQELEENNQQLKIHISRQEEKVTGLKISIDDSKKKISSLRDENMSQEYVQILRNYYVIIFHNVITVRLNVLRNGFFEHNKGEKSQTHPKRYE